MTSTPVLLRADCLDVLRTLSDCSVDSICTDPPYGLAAHRPERVAAALLAWLWSRTGGGASRSIGAGSLS